MPLFRRSKPEPVRIRLVATSRAGRAGYDAYLGDRRLAWGASETAALAAAQVALSSMRVAS